MLEERKKVVWLAALFGYPLVLIITLRCASFPGSGLWEFMEYVNTDVTYYPFRFKFCKNTIPATLAVSGIYFMIFFIIITSMKNTRYGEEYGSARWVSPESIRRKYQYHNRKDPMAWQKNIILTNRIRINLHTQQKNLNTLIIGGSGAGKTRGFILPNLMQQNSSFVVTDPKGEILRMVGKLLTECGYDIRVLDLKNHYKSHGYNPFRYFRNDNDILLFVNNMWGAMEDKAATKGEQIWDDQAKSMLMSFMLFLHHYAPPEEQNFDMVMSLLHEVDTNDGPKKGPSAVDILFSTISDADPAYGYYKDWSSAKGRTLASIVSTLSARMSVFNLESMRRLTYHDEMDIVDLATKKTAVFMLLPDDNAVYNFLAGTLYTQMFQQLYDYADNITGGPLPMHVRFYMDEFANIALPNDYEKILSTARSRNMSFVIVLQNKQQIEAIFEKYWKALIGNCNIHLFLGSPELDTCKYFSELMGKETIHVYTYTRNYGRNSGVSRNEQITGRELMTADELRNLDTKKCIMLIYGEYASLDQKYVLRQHREYAKIADGEKRDINAYDHGNDTHSTGSIQQLPSGYSGQIIQLPAPDGDWELLDLEDINKMID